MWRRELEYQNVDRIQLAENRITKFLEQQSVFQLLKASDPRDEIFYVKHITCKTYGVADR
jgi:hypothetical protein